MECVAAKRGLFTFKDYSSEINVAHISSFHKAKGEWELGWMDYKRVRKAVPPSKVGNFFRYLLGRPLDTKVKRYSTLYYNEPSIIVYMNGEYYNTYYFRTNTIMEAEYARLRSMMI